MMAVNSSDTDGTFGFITAKQYSSGSVPNNFNLGELIFSGTDGSGTNFNAAGIRAQVDGASGTGDLPGRLVFLTASDGASNYTERMRITSDGYLRMASGSGGIQFGGDTAAANALDDYEEGTFTPAIAGQTSAGTGTYSSQAGKYTKIGRFVHVVITLVWSAHTGTGNMLVTGLPFTNLAGDNPSAVNLVSNITVTGQVATELTAGATNGRLFSLNNGTSAQLALDTAGTYELTIGYFTS
jgi:hypothetical protein